MLLPAARLTMYKKPSCDQNHAAGCTKKRVVTRTFHRAVQKTELWPAASWYQPSPAAWNLSKFTWFYLFQPEKLRISGHITCLCVWRRKVFGHKSVFCTEPQSPLVTARFFVQFLAEERMTHRQIFQPFGPSDEKISVDKSLFYGRKWKIILYNGEGRKSLKQIGSG